MKRNTVIYFVVFGFLFGLFNTVDSHFVLTGGHDTPNSVILNLPAMYVQEKVGLLINTRENSRLNMLRERVGLTVQEESISKEEFERLTPEQKEAFLSKIKQYKNLARNDPIAGENGKIKMLRANLYFIFPITSAIGWGLIGIIFYFISWLLKIRA